METENQNGFHLDDDTRKFISDFILEGTVGLLINDIKNKEHYDKEKTISNVCAIIKTTPEVLVRVSEYRKSSKQSSKLRTFGQGMIKKGKIFC